MLSLNEIQDLLADSFFNGSAEIAGLVMFSTVLLLLAAFTAKKNLLMFFLITLPVILIFSTLGVLSQNMTVLMLLIAVIGLAMTARRVF